MTLATIQASLTHAEQALQSCVPHPRFEAELLLAFVLKQTRSYLHAWPEKPVGSVEYQLFTEVLRRRLQLEPLAYITGTKEFWSLDFLVTSDTLIPRPETELIVEMILEMKGDSPQLKLADLGTGSGAIALSIAHERPAWEIYATDMSENALQIARKNAQRLGIENVSFSLGSWCTALPQMRFNVIVSNPPYLAETEWELYADGLAFEPKTALLSGRDGLEAIREISHASRDYLCRDGYLFIEHGFEQGKAVRDILCNDQYRYVNTYKDLSGQDRVTIGQR